MRTRLLPLLLVSILMALSSAACDKPTEADCKAAIDNLNKLHDVTSEPKKDAPAIRKCQTSSKKASVTCIVKATTVEQANACK